jgi:DNA-binding GntR family transcriptional regulator
VEPIGIPKPSSLAEQIHRALSKAILTNELKPGTPLTEAELQKWFGVSRAPIREAIRLLESEGLVVTNAFKTRHVRKLTAEELQETYTVLACLEGFAGNLATNQISREQLGGLEKNIGQMEEAYRGGDLDSCSKLNFEFHRTINRAANNSVLRRSISNIMKSPGWYWLTRVYYDDNPGLVLSSIADHTEILKGLRTGVPELAEAAVRLHMFNIRSNWRDQM